MKIRRRTTKRIVFSVIAAFIAIILFRILFVIDLSQYIAVEFNADNDGYLYDGNIEYTIKIDKEALARRSPVPAPIVKKYLFTSPYDYMVERCLNLKTGRTGIPRFSDCSADDTIQYSVQWNPMDGIFEAVYAQLFLGAVVNTQYQSVSLTVAEEAERQGLTIKQPTAVNVLQYVKENDLLITKKNVYGDYLVLLKPFETEINGVKLVKKGDTGRVCQVLDENGVYLGELEFKINGHLDWFGSGEGPVTVSCEPWEPIPQICLEGNPFTYEVEEE